MSILDRARYLRRIIERLAGTLDDAEALSSTELFQAWETGKEYAVGDRVRYDGTLYKCLISHISQDDWAPSDAVSLWAVVLIPDPEDIPEWVQPDSTNPYMLGDKVMHNGITWISDIDNNIWEPGVYGWSELS